MVFDSKTFEILHGLSELGKKNYAEMLESQADELLVKSEHGLLSFVLKALGTLGLRIGFLENRWRGLLAEARKARS